MKIPSTEIMCERALDLIGETPFEKLGELTVERIARELDTSISYLCRCFRISLNLPPHSFILVEKMARAAKKLRSDPGITVNELASTLCFCHTNYFITCFKTCWGMTPGAYRDTALQKACRCHENCRQLGYSESNEIQESVFSDRL